MKEQKDWEKFYSSFSKFTISPEHKEISKFINKIAPNCATLVDIGCGNGEYSVCLSQYYVVTPIDISPQLIDKLNSNLASKKNINIRAVCIDYSYYKERHDISFCSFSPYIQSVENLSKIISLTNNYLFILTVDNGSYDFHRFALLKLLPPKKLSGFIKNGDWFRETLTKLDITYNEKKYTNTSTENIKQEEALQYYLTYFNALGYSNNETYQLISNYLNSNCVNGILTETHVINKVLIYFSTK